MEVEKTPIEGVLLIKPIVHSDERGYFLETWQEKRYKEAGLHFHLFKIIDQNLHMESYAVYTIKKIILKENLFLYHWVVFSM